MLDFGAFILGGITFGWTALREDTFAILDAFVEGGGRAIDTADLYPAWVPGRRGGESETLIGEWLVSRKSRDRVAIHTKVAKWFEHPGLSAGNIGAAIDASLQRLQTDHVDVYYAHEDDDRVEQAEYVFAFDRLVKSGKVRTLGASNFSAHRLEAAVHLAREHHLSPFEVSQDHYNLVERGVETSLLPTLERLRVVELPYYSLAAGFLTGKYRPGVHVESARGAGHRLGDTRNVALLSHLDDIAAQHRVSVAAVALAWLKAQPGVGAPLASVRTVEQLAPMFEAATLSLSHEEVARLSQVTAP